MDRWMDIFIPSSLFPIFEMMLLEKNTFDDFN